MHPFTGLATREDGAIKVCCRSHPIGFIQKDSLEDIWNNESMLRIRRQVLNDERPKECEPCFSLEDQGVESLRQRHIKGVIPEARINLYPNALDSLNDDYTMPFQIPTMEIKLNNLCNLKCRMCHPMDSTSWNDWNEVEEFYIKENNFLPKKIHDLNLINKPHLKEFDDNPNWWDSFSKVIPYFRRAEFAGGEPLMDPQHYKILDMLVPYGQELPNISRIVGAVAVQVSNALVLDKMIKYFLDDLGIVFYTNMVKYPNVLSVQTLPIDLKNTVYNRLRLVQRELPEYKLVKEHPKLLGITDEQINGIINFMFAKDEHHLWADTVEFNRRLDNSRNSRKFVEVTPEFKNYI